ncbi:MAG: hypothetical protein E7460_03755 [Ruminococcaceae bacterium]|nr:hypothetical protein [Oscillospiraceae bacterium]
MSTIKRVSCVVLALVMLLGLVPAGLVANAASAQVYYNIDFSDAVMKSRILSVNSTDCALVSLCTAESYLYGATSAADKKLVYNAVINKNLGTTSGVPRDNAVQSWGALGYATKTYSLQGLYDQLEQGYPVLVHRYKSDNAQHWSVVCGYKGSTTTLEKSGFIVVDIENGTGKSTLSQWHKSGYTLKTIGYRKNGVAIDDLSGIRMAINHPPVIHPQGAYHTCYGWVTSKNALTKVTVTVTNLSTGKNVINTTVPVGGVTTDAKIYDIDSQMTFAKWPAGKYYYVVRAWDSAGNVGKKAFYFEIGSSYPASAPAPTYNLYYDGGVINATLPATKATWEKTVTLNSAANFVPASFFDEVMLDICTFENWNAYRSDGKWYTTAGKEWQTQANITSKGYTKYTYVDKLSFAVNAHWITDATSICSYTFSANWRLGDTVFASDATAPTANSWFKANNQWYYIKDGGSSSATLPATLSLGEDLSGAQRINVFVDSGETLKVKLPTNANGKVFKVNTDGTVDELAYSGTASSVEVTVDESCVLAVVKAAAPVESSDVVRVYGNDRYQTSLKAADALKEELGAYRFDVVVVASGTDFADALSGSYLANRHSAPILLVRNNNNTMNAVKEYIKENVTPGGTVYLLGGTNAVPVAMERGLEEYDVLRLSGATRYDTNLAVLEECGVYYGADLLVCTGKDFADGLSSSAVDMPVMLVKDGLTTAQKNYLNRIGGLNNIYVIGGENAVSPKVENALKAYGSVTRISGATRYDTSINIARTFFPGATSAVLAYGQDFPDGLSGGALANHTGAPLILTATAKNKVTAAYTVPAGIESGYVLGGPGLISDASVKNIFAMTSGETITVK